MREIFTIVFFGILGAASERTKKENNYVPISKNINQKEIKFLEKRIDIIREQIISEKRARNFSVGAIVVLMIMLVGLFIYFMNLALDVNLSISIVSCLTAVFAICISIDFSIVVEQNSKIYNLNSIIFEYEYKIKQLEEFQND